MNFTLTQLEEELFTRISEDYTRVVKEVNEVITATEQKYMAEGQSRRNASDLAFKELYPTLKESYKLRHKCTHDIVKESKDTAKKLIESLKGRVYNKVGDITDVSELRIKGGEINGLIKGTKGECKVTTIKAGGHSIQRLHFRVLVK